jgi:L-alanine-DL-glutamate epimerase-like enolase superfamily enzyme
MTSTVDMRSFPSFKVKVGHQDLKQDTSAMLRGFQRIALYHVRLEVRIRADANRAWNESQSVEFASALEGIDVRALQRVEFIVK